MRIAINSIFLQGKQEGYGYFIQEIVQRWVEQYPEHDFILLFDRPYTDLPITAPNVTTVVQGPPARHPLLFIWWYNVTLPLIPKKIKPDVLFQPFGFCSLTTGIPQVLTIHDLSYLHYPHFISKAQEWFYRFFTPRFVKKATVITTVSDFSKQDIIRHYPVAETKTTIVYSGVKPVFKPVAWEAKEQFKEQHTAGCEYFVCVGGWHPRKNIMCLLKAFSLFKKRQRSNMKLVLIGRKAWQYESIVQKLATYKYRADVIIKEYLDAPSVAEWVACAYALVYPSFFEGFGVPPLEAMQSGVPTIASNTSSIPEICGEAASYADPNSPEQFAQQMNMLYADERLRSELIQKGLLHVQQYHWDRTAALLWQALLKSVQA